MLEFHVFWGLYPKRKGSNPKAPAEQRFNRAVANGVHPELILAGVRAFAAESEDKIGTEFVPMAVTWLNQRRWEQYEATMLETVAPLDKIFIAVDTPQWQAWDRWRRATVGRPFPQYDRKVPGERMQRGWWYDAEWPPEAISASPIAPSDWQLPDTSERNNEPLPF